MYGYIDLTVERLISNNIDMLLSALTDGIGFSVKQILKTQGNMCARQWSMAEVIRVGRPILSNFELPCFDSICRKAESRDGSGERALRSMAAPVLSGHTAYPESVKTNLQLKENLS